MIRAKSLAGRDMQPRVTVKFAQTLDGRIATSTGDSKWISSAQSLRFAHTLRAQHDAILVGIGTVVADNPQLTVRLVKGDSPVRVIVDSRLRIPLNSILLSDDNNGQTLIATTRRPSQSKVRRIQNLGVEVLQLPLASGGTGVNLRALIKELGRRGIRSVLVEGGSAIITSLLKARLVDRLVVVVAPKMVGRGVESIGDLGIKQLRNAIQFSAVKVRRLGPDVVFDAKLGRRVL